MDVTGPTEMATAALAAAPIEIIAELARITLRGEEVLGLAPGVVLTVPVESELARSCCARAAKFGQKESSATSTGSWACGSPAPPPLAGARDGHAPRAGPGSGGYGTEEIVSSTNLGQRRGGGRPAGRGVHQ